MIEVEIKVRIKNKDEIAEKLHKPLGSVKSRLHYARKKFQKLLKEEDLA